jgi:hypothetical protein
MAAGGLNNLAELLSREPRPFEPRPYYESLTDSLIYYFRNEKSYSKRITKYFTVFLSCEDDSLVGIEVKSLKTIMKAIADLGEVDVVEPPIKASLQGQEVALRVIAHCALTPEPETPVSGAYYDELEAHTRGVRIRLDDLCLV